MHAEVHVQRARSWLEEVVRRIDPREPFAAALVRIAGRLGHDFDPGPLLAHWATLSVGSPLGTDRYRWELTHARATGIPEYAGPPETWRAWHPSEQSFVDRDVFEFEARFTQPIVLCECVEFLEQAAALGYEGARAFLHEAEPALRRDFAGYVQTRSPTTDTFALWVLVRSSKAFERLGPIMLAIAECYAATARLSRGRVLGARFPFHEQPLVSATAALAASLFKLGLHVDLFARLSDFVRTSQHADGGWADASEPTDVLTTLICADLLSRTDPTFDPREAIVYFEQAQRPSGEWRVFGPEAPWLTAAVLDWLVEAENSSFAERFRWPHVPAANLDKKTRLPFYACFTDLAQLFALEGFGRASTEIAFIDLAGFREFNNRFGQDSGDAVLGAFATELARLPAVRAIRDGGDEFLVVGAPTREGLREDLDAFRRRWPHAFGDRFGREVPTVAPRILVSSTPCGALLATRETLGRRIGELKKRSESPGPEGILEAL